MITYEGKICPPPEGFIAIVVAKFNRSITQRLLDGALAKLHQNNVRDKDIRVCWVPGAFEIPAVAARFAEMKDCLAVITLGAVIKGETSHDEHINRAVSMELARIGVDCRNPVIFGVLTCNTVEQANARSGLVEQSRDKAIDPTAGNKGAEAAEAALEMIDLYTEIPEEERSFPGMEMLDQFMSTMGPPSPDFFDVDDLDDDLDDDDSEIIFDTRFLPPPPPRKRKKATRKKKK